MRILVIRHGESEADILDVHEGRADFELTERGHRQAEAMAHYVKEHYDISAIYCSTLKRAYQTAAHLSEATGIQLTPEEKLMEFVVLLQEKINHQFDISKNTQKMRSAIDYIETHYADDLNMAVVSNHISMNYSRFSYSFKQYT